MYISFETYNKTIEDFLRHFKLDINQTILSKLSLLKTILKKILRLPYENLSKIIRYRSDIPDETKLRMPDEVWIDFIMWRNGGTCFSLTYFLFQILRYCGFDCYLVMGNMRYGENIHCAIIVKNNEKNNEKHYLCDVGYLIPIPLELSSNPNWYKNPIRHLFLEPEEKGYNLITRNTKVIKKRFLIKDKPVNEIEFRYYWLKSFDYNMMTRHLITRLMGD